MRGARLVCLDAFYLGGRSATFACMGLWLGCLGVVLWAFSSRAPKGEEFHLEV